MEQIKRLRNDIIDDYNDSKKTKIDISLTKEYPTTFEDLSNELIYEIFEYIDYHHAFQPFYDLNQRFQNLFVHSNLPIKVNISSISKSAFQYYVRDIIIPHIYLIKLLRLANPFVVDMCLLLFPLMRNLIRLETLIIDKIESNYIEQVLDHLSCLPVLSSITITSIDNANNLNNIYYKIFRLRALKYCQILIETLGDPKPLSMATNEFSPLEHLVINSKILISQVDSLLSYVPQLRRLSFGNLNGYNNKRANKTSIMLNYLRNVSLKLCYATFDDLEHLFEDCFHKVEVLRIAPTTIRLFGYGTDMFNANRWERLISTFLPDLHIFDFQHECRITFENDVLLQYKIQVNEFNSLFWMKHQWFFENHYYQRRYSNGVIFFTTNPYRRKYYMLCNDSNENTASGHAQTNLDSVHHVHIHTANAMKQFIGHFPNVTELTLSEYFDVPRDSTAMNLNRMVPLKQLTKLIINCHRFSFQRLIKLLSLTSNVHTLQLGSILLYGTDSTLIQQNEIFQMVSKTNNITNVTIAREITLEKIELLAALFPRIEYLTINLDKEDLKSIARFLLSTSNINTQHLSLLCLSYSRRDSMEKLKDFIQSEKLLHDFTIKFVDRNVYLWW